MIRISQLSLRLFAVAACVGVLALMNGCGYYWQAVSGHMQLMSKRRPVAEVVADVATPEAVRARLVRTSAMLDFAHQTLLLPDNGSYRQYADTGRPAVVWNVIATAEFSTEPRSWCFLVIGCINYRGYFDRSDALEFARQLDESGDDTYVGGVTAYSTLGRFADPLLNTMVGLPDYRLAGLLFHELAHQKIYARDDSAFNESFASFVEQEGIRRWLGQYGTESERCEFEQWLIRLAQVRKLLAATSQALTDLYASNVDAAAKRTGKARVLQQLNQDYFELRNRWQGPPYFDGWFGARINNASLAAVGLYADLVPAFSALYAEQGRDFGKFFQAVQELADAPADARITALLAVAGQAMPALNAQPIPGSCRAASAD